MDLLLRTIDKTAGGREIVREKVLTGESFGIGRAAGNAVPLADLAVEQNHAIIVPAPEGRLRIEAVGGIGFGLDGRQVTSATINPRESHELAFGEHRISIAEEDGKVSVTIRQAEDGREQTYDALAGFALAHALPSKRAMAWGAVALILALFLALPIVSGLMRPEAKPQIGQSGMVLMDASWSTGSLSVAHHGLEDNCEACHVKPFVAVRDETCLTCHADIADHAAEPKLAAGRGGENFGDALLWQVAHLFNKPGPGACTDCHTEHEGAGRMEPTAQKFCADCHGTLDTRLTQTALGNASDFGRAHPQFQAAIFTSERETRPARVSLTARPREWKGLRFPHDVHLDPNGGVARMAGNIGARRGYGAQLECKDCHRPTADGVRFLPVDMERDCESCHDLSFDRVAGIDRKLSHGNVEQMQADILALDRTPRRPVVSGLAGRQRPGQFAPGGLYYQDFGRTGGAYVGINRALAARGVCGECHYPTTVNGRAAVLPVHQPDRYFMHGWFDHADHTQETCTSCHKAETSGEASDLLLPGVAQCRTCHLGEGASAPKTPSSCAMCHSYHPRAGPAAAPPRIALRDGR